MATNNLIVRKGQCINFGNCTVADTREIVEVKLGDEFVCPNCDCGGTLVEVKPKPPAPKWIINAIGGFLALLGAGATFYIFSNNNVDIDVINEKLIIIVNENQPLPENIINVIAEKQVEWESSNPNIAIINNNVFIARSEGTATITATLLNKKDTLVICSVTVVANELKPTPPINVIVEVPTVNSGESTTLSYSGGNGKIFKWYSGSCGGTLVGEGNNLTVTPSQTTTYYGRWEDGDKVSECQKITVTVRKEEQPVSAASFNIVVNVPAVSSGESTTLSYSGDNGNGKTFKWYSGSCGGILVGEGNNLTVTPSQTTTYYGRWEDGDKVSECQKITVTVRERIVADRQTLDLGYAVWTGRVRDGRPHDVQGTLRFKSQHLIDTRDPNKRTANAGDKVIGEFSNGHLVQGFWHKSDGNVESIIIGD